MSGERRANGVVVADSKLRMQLPHVLVHESELAPASGCAAMLEQEEEGKSVALVKVESLLSFESKERGGRVDLG